jgi:hypothetical protein
MGEVRFDGRSSVKYGTGTYLIYLLVDAHGPVRRGPVLRRNPHYRYLSEKLLPTQTNCKVGGHKILQGREAL